MRGRWGLKVTLQHNTSGDRKQLAWISPQENCKVAFRGETEKAVILSAAKNLVNRGDLRYAKEILRCAQNDGFLGFAVFLDQSPAE
jgi:hypothetical protein